MKSAPFVSPNFLERVAEPESPFHPDYLAYRRSEITRAELINRLPHVAMLGDSVCTSVYISSPWSTLWRAHTSRGKNWFLHLDAAPSICSISKGLETITPFVAIECAGVGALVDHEHCRQNLLRRILGTRNFSGQVGELLRARRFPDLILISIGHNNVDWAWRCPLDELHDPEERLQRLSKEFRQNYARELRRLLEGARIQQHRVAIVVYGLINFESYFKGREAAERLRESDTTLYPHLETTYKYFISFHPDLPAQFDSACGDGERRAARDGGSVESRIRPSDRTHSVAIFQCAGDGGPQPRGITASNRWMARVRGRTQCSGGRCVQRSESKFGVSWDSVTKE